MNYSDMLLKQIRKLNGELGRYSEPATPEESARRDALLQALAWYVHKLQMRVLSTARTPSISPAADDCWTRGVSQGVERSSHAAPR